MSIVPLETEPRRLAERLGLPRAAATGLLDRFDLVELDRSVLREAGPLLGSVISALNYCEVVRKLAQLGSATADIPVRLTR